MAGCDCCCEVVANYRGHRRAPSDVTFVSWINEARNFHEREVHDDYVPIADEDAYGPETLQTDGNWIQPSPPWISTDVTGGSLTIESVWGNKHFLVVGVGLGGGLADGSTLTYVAAGKTAVLLADSVTATLGEMTAFSGGSYADMLIVSLQYGSESLRIMPVMTSSSTRPRVEIAAWHELDDDTKPWSITVSAGSRTKGGRSSSMGEINRDPNFFTPRAEKPGALWNTGPYFNVPVYVRGEKVTLYRNGEVVLTGIRPSDAETLAATDEDGSYLVVSEVDETTNRPWTGTGIDTRRRWPRPFKQLASFVVDRDAPIIAVSPRNDYWTDDSFFERLERDPWWMATTKPLWFNWLSGGRSDTQNDDNTVVRPAMKRPQNWADSWEIGATIFIPPGLISWHPYTELRDRAGNAPIHIWTPTYTNHAVPPNNRRGARPHLENVGLQTREYFRPRFEHEQVKAVRLTWDRKVKADTVDASQVTLTRNGEAVSGCQIEQQSDIEWLITLPEDETQDSKSFWVLTYDPAGDVLTDDIVTVAYDSYESFPPVEKSHYKKVYVDSSTGDRYSKSPDGYVDIGDGPPLDEDGVEYEPEPCVLATRTGWLMTSFEGWLEPEDVASREVLIGTTPSIYAEESTQPDDDGSVTITATPGFGFSDLGSHTRGIAPDAFTPLVPCGEDPPDDCSYWGLKTTIDPCPPRSVTDCAAPRAAQPHSSVIRSEETIDAITLTVVYRDPSTGGEGAPQDIDPMPRFGDISLAATFNGSTLPQNVWAGELPELEPEESSNLLGAYTTTVLGGTLFLEAFRYVSEYAGRETAYLHELELEVQARFHIKTHIIPTEAGVPYYGATPVDQYTAATVSDRFAISKEQEDALAAGNVVYVRWRSVSSVSGSYWWKLQKA